MGMGMHRNGGKCGEDERKTGRGVEKNWEEVRRKRREEREIREGRRRKEMEKEE